MQEPCILPNPKDPTRLVMFYSGVPGTNRSVCFIGKAWALKSDPFTWHQDARNPVFGPGKEGWDSGSIRLDAVLCISEEDAYYIYYSGTTASVQDRIGLAICPAGADGYSGITPAAIRRFGSEPVLAPESAAPYFEQMASQSAVLREWDAKAQRWDWYMYYSYRGKDGVLPGLRLATSPDGKNWTRHFNEKDPRGMGQIFASTPGAYYEWHQVFKLDNTYLLSMEVGISAGKRWRPVIAVSERPAGGWAQMDVDTMLQTKWEGLYQDSTLYHVATPALYPIDGRWYLYAQACPLPANGNYIDGQWDLWCVACDRLIPTVQGGAGIFVPGQPGPVESLRPGVRIVEGGESPTRPEDCRATLVGPGVNQPDPFPGYGGFVGWESPVRLRNGDWLVGFNAGYWHASAPTPLRYPAKTLETYRKLGLPADIIAPTGGRALIMRSSDAGKTWSKPVTLVDTPADDRHPAFVELGDGTLLCSFFTYSGEPENGDWSQDPSLAVRVHFIRSFDGGRTWEKQSRPLQTGFTYDETDGPLPLLKDGSVLVAVNGRAPGGPPDQAAVWRSTNGGESWKLLATVRAAHDLQEVTVAELPDGQLVMMARPEGDICWSHDHGHTWTPPVTFGFRLFAPSLYVLRDATLVCLHGSYAPGYGGLRVIFSTDGGHSWIAPATDHGFLVDNAYGYGKAMELPDGSLFITYLSSGGHRAQDARSNSIRCIRLRVRPDHSGIDLLPAPNR